MPLKDVEVIVESFTQEIVELLSQEELRMLRITKKRLAKGIDEDGWAEKKLSQIQAQKAELVAAQLDVNSKVNILIREQHVQAYENGYKFGIADGKDPRYLRTGDIKVPAKVRALILERTEVLKNQQLTILRTSMDAYRSIISDVTSRSLLGTVTRQQALQMALNQFADAGITGFTDKAGRNWNLTTYTDMATRTTAMNANRIGAFDRNLDNGRDLVIVSSHGFTCPFCAPYEGQVLSISGDNTNYPSIAAATADGLFHPNCKHTVTGYVPGLSVIDPPFSNYKPEQYVYTEDQRYNERMIRKWKKRGEVSLDPLKKSDADMRIKFYQSKQRKLLNEYEDKFGQTLKRRYDRESINRVGRKGVEKIVAKAPVVKEAIKKIDLTTMNKKQLSEYAENNLKFRKVRFGKMPDDVARSIIEQTERFYNDYPEYAGFSREIKNSSSKTIYGQYGSLSGQKIKADINGFYDMNPGVKYSDYLFDSEYNARVRYERDVRSGGSPKGTKWTDVIIHENSHGLERFMTAKEMGIADRMDKLTRDEISQYVNSTNHGLFSRKTRDEALSNLGITAHKDIYDATVNISSYAIKNSKETLAEAFADVYANGSNAQPLSKEMVKITNIKYKELTK